jgi:cysteine desulfurase / selenocysteine lyase
MTKTSSDIVPTTPATGAAAPDPRDAAAPGHKQASGFPVEAIRSQFPILTLKVHGGKPLVYLDNAATTQKPQAVIDAISRYYSFENANIHRGVYWLSQVATEAYEGSRRRVRQFINAESDREIIFTRGTTESINLVASSFGAAFVRPGDEIIVSHLEHHSNIVPWQMACERFGAVLRVIPINDRGELRLDEYARLLKPGKTKLVAVSHLSNSLGTVNDVKSIAEQAHAAGARVLVDGAQWIAHYPTDVQDLQADFYTFSAHKLYGPTGIGVLYGRRELLEAMPPYQGGGDMIESVRFEKTTYADLPNRFEAGTPDIAGAVGLGAAIDWISRFGLSAVAEYEDQLTQYMTEQIGLIPGLRIIGTAGRKGGICSFVMENPSMSPHDAGVLLDLQGVAVRTGHHCCQPVMERLGVSATVRASIAVYNTQEEIDALVRALHEITRPASRQQNKPSASVSEEAARQAAAEAWFAGAVAPSPVAAADELAETFDLLGERDERNQYILELGEKLPELPAELKTDRHRVHGCMSTVHLVGRRQGDVLEFAADSDAHIVRGLIAILQRLYSGQRPDDILAFDNEAFFRRINLEQFISSQRRNGLEGMVKRIRRLATELESAG